MATGHSNKRLIKTIVYIVTSRAWRWNYNSTMTRVHQHPGTGLPAWSREDMGIQSTEGLYTVIDNRHDKTKHTNSFFWKGLLRESLRFESFSMPVPTQPSRAWRSCHMSKWLSAAHQKKCRGPSLCLHGRPESSAGTSLGGSRSWLCYHRHQWARNSHG